MVAVQDIRRNAPGMASGMSSPATVQSPTSTLDHMRSAYVVETDFARTLPSPAYQSDEQILSSPSRPQMRSMSISHHLAATVSPSRQWLTTKAKIWRGLMALGMVFHFWHPKKAPKARYVHKMANKAHPIKLHVYVPANYDLILRNDPCYRFPCVVNFHGGGFCIGSATDDAYWARIVLERTHSIFISVGYRKAPEHPFPQPVDDCVEALLYIASHASDFHVDPSNMALSGFSAGANLVFTSLLKLRFHHRLNATETHPQDKPDPASPLTSPKTGNLSIPTRRRPADLYHASSTLNHPTLSPPKIKLTKSTSSKITPLSADIYYPSSTTSLALANSPTSELPLTIRSIIAWYPLCDWTASRNKKRQLSKNPKKTLSSIFTDLFDPSYLPPPDLRGDHISPYASPGLAPEHMIVDGLPQHIQMWLCEWDMLLQEGVRFSDRLTRSKKDVSTEILPGTRHGFDKSPNPFRDQDVIDALYIKAADRLNKIFDPGSTPKNED